MHSKNKDQRRSAFEIFATILRATKKERTQKTKLLHHASIDYKLFQRYFDFLIDGNFIEQTIIEVPRRSGYGCLKTGIRDAYIITPKGEELLQNIEAVLTIFHDIGKRNRRLSH